MPFGLVAALVLVTGGCAALGPWVGGPGEPRALASTDGVADRSFQQILTLHYDQRSRRFLAAGQVCDGELALALLTPQGLELLRLRYGRDGLEVVNERGLPPGLTARAILADFQLIHWPAAALRAAWAAPWTLQAGGGHRQALYRGEPQVRVRYAGDRWADAATLADRVSNYRLRVQPREHAVGDCGGSARGPAESDRVPAPRARGYG